MDFEYDHNGVRRSKTINGTRTHFLVDPNRDYAQVFVEYADGGSTRALTDSAGLVTDRYTYTAFGEMDVQSGSTENDYLYTGEQFDAELDQYYLRARYYDPSVGRFTQMDTFQGRLNAPVTLHKYLYGNVDPVNHVDPSGNFGIDMANSSVHIVGRFLLDSLQGPAVSVSATNLAARALVDGCLTLWEANEILRANSNSNFVVTVDASQLTVLKTGNYHGSVTSHRNSKGVVSIAPGEYDFQPHIPVNSFRRATRNLETYGGFYVGSVAGTYIGTDYLIKYSGSPKVVR